MRQVSKERWAATRNSPSPKPMGTAQGTQDRQAHCQVPCWAILDKSSATPLKMKPKKVRKDQGAYH